MNYCFIYITYPDKASAQKSAEDLVKNKLVACVNIYEPVTSIYWWKGKIQKEKEVIFIAKTQKKLFEKVKKRIEKTHPYSCPCIIALPIQKGNAAYLKWMKDNTA